MNVPRFIGWALLVIGVLGFAAAALYTFGLLGLTYILPPNPAQTFPPSSASDKLSMTLVFGGPWLVSSGAIGALGAWLTFRRK
jgi:hypothetical protein